MVPTSRQVYDSPPDERGETRFCNPLWRASLSFGSDTITPSLAGIRFARSSVGKLTFYTPTMSPTIYPDDATTDEPTDDLALVETPGYGPRVLCPRHQRGTEIMEGRQ